MDSITTALAGLQQLLSAEFPAAAGIQAIDVPFSLKDRFDPLAWIAGQHTFPRFYWQQRNGDEEAATLGALVRCACVDEAQRFLRQHSVLPDIRLWGLSAFTAEQGFLFLPRLEWRRCAGVAVLRLYLFSAISLRDDVREARAFIAALAAAKPLPELQPQSVNVCHQPTRAEWKKMTECAIRMIATGKLDKVVLARATDLQFPSPVNAAAVMAASRRLNLNCYHFLMLFDASSAFLGSSPERLWRRRGRLLRTEALAGTVASHPDERHAGQLGAWLIKDDKNQRENMLVVEDIRQRLQNHVRMLEVLPPRVMKLRKVQHLRRCIRAELYQPDDGQCLRMLQPTAAVAGLPREQAKRFIRQNEPFAREWYAGCAGYLSRQQSEFCVTLRCAKVADCTVRLYAGAGIVNGSDPDQEWLEIENKAAGLGSLLQMTPH